MTNMHQGCDYYIEQNDMYLLFFQLGFHEVSQYKECLEEVIYND